LSNCERTLLNDQSNETTNQPTNQPTSQQTIKPIKTKGKDNNKNIVHYVV
jgi:hypothetical protein